MNDIFANTETMQENEHPRFYTAESVMRGHPDKLCDLIADSVLDACLQHDPASRVACEVMATHGHIIVAGEITTSANYISGQYSDGWGEGFEQRDIRVEDGTLAVHFWQEDGFKMTPSFEKIQDHMQMTQRPKMQLIGQDGNIFAIMGRASRLLKSSGQGDKAKEMRDRVMSCDSYQKALNIVSEYVETELSPSPTPKRDRGDAR